MTASEAFGGPITQTTLNTFKQAGSSSNISGGIEAYKEILEVRVNRKKKVTTIAFVDKDLSFSTVLNTKKRQLVGLMVGDLILDYNIDTKKAIFNGNQPFWYTDYKLFFPKSKFTQSSDHMIRLKIDVNSMYSSGIIPGDICDAIMRQSYQDFKIECVFSPILMETDTVKVIRDVDNTETVSTRVPRVYIDIHLLESELPTSGKISKSILDIHILNNMENKPKWK